MKIKNITVTRQAFELTRPYTIAYKTQTHVENVIIDVELEDHTTGLGSGSPSFEVTGETMDLCLDALQGDQIDWLIGRSITELPTLRSILRKKMAQTPAACAAVDIALHDLYAKKLNQPLVDVLGCIHKQMPTSITVGIKNVQETLDECQEYVERGFTHLKIKIGHALEEDIERLIKIREQFGHHVTLRVDPNQAYSLSELANFMDVTKRLNLELIEQPLSVKNSKRLQELSLEQKKLIALDESILNPSDAIKILQPSAWCGILNIKLMKCGGIFGALQLATIAQAANLELMWGCNDESIISITAALHTAFANPATRYIDLDGSLDLAKDVVLGGFEIKKGVMFLSDSIGLGVKRL